MSHSMCIWQSSPFALLTLTFEQGTQAAWLYDLVKPLVSHVVICNGTARSVFGLTTPFIDEWLSGVQWLATMSSHLVTQLNHAVLVGFDPCEMEGDVSVEVLEKWDPIANQDRQDRITNFVG